MSLRIALFGQAPLAIDTLDRLRRAGHEVVSVYAPPDGARPDALAAHARSLGLRVVQRRFFQRKDGQPIPAALREYAEAPADLNVLASMTSFLPREITHAPRLASLCFHPSLLPRFRGGHALQWQILLGEPTTGVTIFVPDSGVDTGPIVVQHGGVQIDDDDTTATLFFRKLAPLGAQALEEAVGRIESPDFKPRVQNETLASFQGLVDEAAAALVLEHDARDVVRRIRGCDPQPGAFAYLGSRKLRLYAAQVDGPVEGARPGQVCALEARGLRIAAGSGSFWVSKLREGSAKESAAEFSERTGLRVGDLLTSAGPGPRSDT